MAYGSGKRQKYLHKKHFFFALKSRQMVHKKIKSAKGTICNASINPYSYPRRPWSFFKVAFVPRMGGGVILRYQYQKELLGNHQAELQRRNLQEEKWLCSVSCYIGCWK